MLSLQTRICFRRIFCALALVWGCVAGVAAAEKKPPTRVALVIGNARYEAAVGPLRNTVNDARAMGKALREVGFAVIEEHNVTRDELLGAMRRFQLQLRGAEVGVFYYSGHGISVAGANYLLPVRSGYAPEGADATGLRMLAETRLFNAEQAVADMSNAGAACNLVILDACRTTPVARNPAARDVAAKGGLVEMNPPAGSLIAFATDAGRAASDGEGTNGLYTAELIAHLRTPGLTIEQVFKRTRAGVMERSGGAQIPAEYSRLVGEDIFLAGPAPATPAEVIPKGQPVPVPMLGDLQKLAAAGETVRCIEGLRRFRKANPGPLPSGPFTTLLDRVKEDLRDPKTAAPRAKGALATCDALLAAMAEDLPADAAVTAKAHNRRGDALLLLARPADALAAYEAAFALTPEDRYIRYNRGQALVALDRKEEARGEFSAAAAPDGKQAGARKLAREALAALK